MNVDLLRKVQATILEDPRRVWMEVFIIGKAVGGKLGGPESKNPACGTMACIAGWACILSASIPENTCAIHEPAQDALQLDDSEANRLFYLDSWPPDLASRVWGCRIGTAPYASIVAERIDRFIATGGME